MVTIRICRKISYNFSGEMKQAKFKVILIPSTFDDLVSALTLIEGIVATTSPNEDELKRSLSPMMLSTDTLLKFPNFAKDFYINTDSSEW